MRTMKLILAVALTMAAVGCGGEPIAEVSAPVCDDSPVNGTPTGDTWRLAVVSENWTCGGGVYLNLPRGGGPVDGEWNCTGPGAPGFNGKWCGSVNASGHATLSVAITHIGNDAPGPFVRAEIYISGRNFSGMIDTPDWSGTITGVE